MSQEPLLETAPVKPESAASWWLALFGTIFSVIFLSNPTLGGIIPFEIPDALPVIGNLDETLVTAILIACLSRLGIDIIPGLHRTRNRGTVIDHPPTTKQPGKP